MVILCEDCVGEHLHNVGTKTDFPCENCGSAIKAFVVPEEIYHYFYNQLHDSSNESMLEIRNRSWDMQKELDSK